MARKPLVLVGLATVLGGSLAAAGCNFADRPRPVERLANALNPPPVERHYVTTPSPQPGEPGKLPEVSGYVWPQGTVVLDYEERYLDPPEIEPVAPVPPPPVVISETSDVVLKSSGQSPEIVASAPSPLPATPLAPTVASIPVGDSSNKMAPGAAVAVTPPPVSVELFTPESDVASTTQVSQAAPSLQAPLPPGPIVPVTHSVQAAPPSVTSTTTIAETKFAGTVTYVKSRTVALDLQVKKVGPSGIKTLQVWGTPDGGVTWNRLSADLKDQVRPQVQLPGNGVFGLRLTAINGNGFGGAAPAPGATPAFWVEVDDAAPLVKLNEVQASPGGEAIDIRWTATDKNLAVDPIAIHFRTSDKGAWALVKQRVANDGHFRWVYPTGAGTRFYIRVSATDKAGNTSHAATAAPVSADTTVPELSITGIDLGR